MNMYMSYTFEIRRLNSVDAKSNTWTKENFSFCRINRDLRNIRVLIVGFVSAQVDVIKCVLGEHHGHLFTSRCRCKTYPSETVFHRSSDRLAILIEFPSGDAISTVDNQRLIAFSIDQVRDRTREDTILKGLLSDVIVEEKTNRTDGVHLRCVVVSKRLIDDLVERRVSRVHFHAGYAQCFETTFLSMVG